MNQVMTTDINAILERLTYIRNCYSDPDCLVFEMVKLSSESIDLLFSKDKQVMYEWAECLKYSLSQVFDTVYSLGQFPFSESPVKRINFLRQLLYEADYYAYPASAKGLREVGLLVVFDLD